MGISARLKDSDTFHEDTATGVGLDEHVEDGLAYLSYSDGLMTAAVVSPEFVPPEEWMPLIIDTLDTEGSIEDLRLLAGSLLQGYQGILDSLRKSKQVYEPFFWKDKNKGLITRNWAEGFFAGVRLRKEAWDAVLQEEGHFIGVSLATLLQKEEVNAVLTESGVDLEEAFNEAQNEAGEIVQLIYDCWADRSSMNSTLSRSWNQKVGRNDPCPCGSGKKYKKCCLN